MDEDELEELEDDEFFMAPPLSMTAAAPLSMTMQPPREVPDSSAGSVSGRGHSSGESDALGFAIPRAPPRPEAPQPKRSSWLSKAEWNDEDGYSSASTPSSDLDSEISDLDTDEEIAALEEAEEAEAQKAKA